MHTPIKFLYALLIITIIGSGMVYWIQHIAVRNDVSFQSTTQEVQNITECKKQVVTAESVGLKSDIHHEYPYDQVRCYFNSIKAGDMFRADIGHETKVIFMYEEGTKTPCTPGNTCILRSPYWTYFLENNPTVKDFVPIEEMSRKDGDGDLVPEGLSFRDFNFDGYLDYVDGGVEEDLSNGRSFYKHMFFFDPKTSSFVSDPSTYSDEPLDIPNGEVFDLQHRTIQFTDTVEYTTHRDTYTFSNGAWTLTSYYRTHLNEDPDVPPGKACEVYEGHTVNGKLVTTKKLVPFYYEKTNSGPCVGNLHEL